MSRQGLLDWRERVEVDIEHLRAVLAQPNDYFSPKGGQHWYQVISRSEIEVRLASNTRLLAHIDRQLARCC